MICKRIIFSVVLLLFLVHEPLLMMASADNSTGATIYLSLVNDAFGFYKIRNLETIPRPFTYDDRVLNINVGDTIIWENDADISTFTIVSDQNLWNDQIGRIKVGQKINYKFDKPGTYTFYMKEVPSMVQTIIVSNIGDVATTVPVTMVTPTYPMPTPTIATTDALASIPTPTSTIAQSAPENTPSLSSTYTVPYIKIPIKITLISFASIVVGILSIYITFRRKN